MLVRRGGWLEFGPHEGGQPVFLEGKFRECAGKDVADSLQRNVWVGKGVFVLLLGAG
jgi:hypothetical protein